MVKITDEIKEIFTILSMEVNSEQDLYSVLIPRDLLLRVDIEQQLTSLIIKLKEKYKSSKLNCLHKNRDDKQKFPGINLVRQILRCNGYHLKPVKFSRGYCKHSGKKIVDRNFKVVRLENYSEIKMAQDKVESELEKSASKSSVNSSLDSNSNANSNLNLNLTSLSIEMVDNIQQESQSQSQSQSTTVSKSLSQSNMNTNTTTNLLETNTNTYQIKEVELNF